VGFVACLQNTLQWSACPRPLKGEQPITRGKSAHTESRSALLSNQEKAP